MVTWQTDDDWINNLCIDILGISVMFFFLFQIKNSVSLSIKDHIYNELLTFSQCYNAFLSHLKHC